MTLKFYLGDAFGIFGNSGWYYLPPESVCIMHQSEITIEETIKAVDHENMHYILDLLSEEEDDLDQFGYDKIYFEEGDPWGVVGDLPRGGSNCHRHLHGEDDARQEHLGDALLGVAGGVEEAGL